MPRSLTVLFALTVRLTLSSGLGLGLGLAGCRTPPAAEDSQLAQAAPQRATQPDAPAEVFDASFVFTIDGMRKINGAL